MKNIIITFFLCLIGCSGKETPVETPNIKMVELIKTPTTLQIDSKKLSLSIYLWRDYMPISPPDGKEMIASVDIFTSDSSAFPTGIDVDKMWVFDSSNIWETNLTAQSPTEVYMLSKRATGGPKWETGIFVDVVIRLVQDDTLYYYLKSENNQISRTD